MTHCWRYCIRRAIAFALVALSCSVVTAGGKPSLLLFTNPAVCPPCRKFDADWGADKAFREAVTGAYAIVPSYQPQTHPGKFTEYKITGVPTWVIVAGGSEINRVSGYTTPTDLWTRLRNATKNTPRARPPDSTPPSAGSVPDRDDSVSEQIRKANRALEVERDELRAETERLKKQLLDAQKTDPKKGGERLDVGEIERLDRINESRLQEIQALIEQSRKTYLEQQKKIAAAEKVAQNATAEAERLRKQCELPAAPEYHDESIAETPVKPETPKRGFLGSILFHGSRFAMDLGFSQVQSEIFAPIAIAAGPVGIAAAAGFAFLRFRQHRARGDPKKPDQRQPTAGGVTVDRTFVVDSPPLPSRERIDTQIVNVESDKYRKAHEQARQQIIRKYPGSQDVLEAELSLTRQFYSGQSQ